jgi:hypothetical protein
MGAYQGKEWERLYARIASLGAGLGRRSSSASLVSSAGWKLVAYEAHVHRAGKHSEVQVGLDGKRLAHLE